MESHKIKENSRLYNSFHLIKETLGEKHYLIYFFIASFLFFSLYTFLYGFWRIPVIELGINRMSEIVASDYLFVILISFLSSLFIMLWSYEQKYYITSASTLGGIGGGVAGFLAGICPVCQSFGIIAFGTTFLSIPTGFLNPYIWIMKIVSIGLLGLAICIKADSIATQKCIACEVFN